MVLDWSHRERQTTLGAAASSAPRRLSLALTAVAGLCLAAWLLRLWRIEAQPLWWDEAISLHLATGSWADILADRAADIHPPLYFLLLKVWLALAGANAFSARFASSALNLLLVAAGYAAGWRLAGRKAGVAAAGLVAISPLYVIYSQEARVYAWLPLLYLGLLMEVRRLGRGRQAERAWVPWLGLALAEVVGLYLHYVFAIAVAYANLRLLIAAVRHHRRCRSYWLRWLASRALAVALCAPWWLAVLDQRAALRADAGNVAPLAQPLPLSFLVGQVWTFLWSGLAEAVGSAPLFGTATALGLLLLAAVGMLTGRRSARARVLGLLADGCLPLVAATLLWRIRPLSHPRYLLAFSIALLMLVAYAVAELARRGRLGVLLGAALGLTVGVNSALALSAWFGDPRFSKDDVRGLAAWLERETRPGDVIVAPWEDWTLDFAYRGPAPIIRPNPLDERAFWDELAIRIPRQADGRAFLVTYPRGTKDRRDLLPFALETAGSLTARRSFKGLLARVYTLERPLAQPPGGDLLPGGPSCFGPLCLRAAWVEQEAPADTAVTVALDWLLQEATPRRLRLSLRLRDPTAWERASLDGWLLDAAGLPSERWRAGEALTTYHVLPLLPGTPPVTCTLSLEVYALREGDVEPVDLIDGAGNPAGRTLSVGPVSLGLPLGVTGDPYRVGDAVPGLSPPVELAPGLVLEGAALDTERATPGQALSVRLLWRAADAPLADLRPALTLSQDGARLVSEAQAPVGGAYPTTRWRRGERVAERRQLLAPAQAPAGIAELALELDGRSIRLGSVSIEPSEHIFEVPPAAVPLEVHFSDVTALVGYELSPPPYRAWQPITLTLYWRALEGAARADYVVFTHLLAADGHPVGQHDGPPVGGRRPTRGWVPGEIITDVHVLEYREGYVGEAHLEIGLYEAGSGARVGLREGGDAFVLPRPLRVE